MYCVHCEPKLSELLSDPILHLLLKRDGVKLDELRNLIEKTRRRRVAKIAYLKEMSRSRRLKPASRAKQPAATIS